MTNISNIPNELLYQMCQSWDTPTLVNMSEAYSRVYQVCSDEILERQIIQIEKKLQRDNVIFNKQINQHNIQVIILRPISFDNQLQIMVMQVITPSVGSETIPWILVEIAPEETEK